MKRSYLLFVLPRSISFRTLFNLDFKPKKIITMKVFNDDYDFSNVVPLTPSNSISSKNEQFRFHALVTNP